MEQHRIGNKNDPQIRPRSPITILRDYLTSMTPEIIERLAPIDELAMRAKIIVEYMQDHEIADVNQGIRSFTAFERYRLEQLGLITQKDARALKASPAPCALATATR